MDAKRLAIILEDHAKWLNGEGGKPANLAHADLAKANLEGVNLMWANLEGAILPLANLSHACLGFTNLEGAILKKANLEGAFLENAKMKGAYLVDANLENANLYGADLRNANLRYANLAHASIVDVDLWYANLKYVNLEDAILISTNLKDADIRGAKNVPFIPMACPNEGPFIGWKKAFNDWDEVIVKLMVTGKRSSATSRKCRCDRAVVLAIESLDGATTYEMATSQYDKKFVYRVGETVTPTEPFCEDRWNECSSGIHFFINRQEAVECNL